MHYASVEGLTKSYGVTSLFNSISFNIEEGDKIALVALNGSGKSTLLKILAGKETPGAGKLWVHKNVTPVLLDQHPVFDENKSVIENIFNHDHPVINIIKQYELISNNDIPNESQLSAVIAKMDELNAWNAEARVKQILGKLSIHHLQQQVATLSGGQQKRLALAKVLIDIGFGGSHPFLILDEPTNHLDVEMIEWLENFLSRENITLLLVTHDRYFLDTVCNEIMELHHGDLFIYKGDYENYLEKKSAWEDAQKASVDKAKNLLRKELDWMRRQPKARTTKSKSRIDAFYDLKEKASDYAPEQKLELQVKMSRLGGKILELKKVYKSFSEKIILKAFDYTFKKGERIGIVGKNGVGKSTFLNIILGLEHPDSGKINVGGTVIFGYYSQRGLDIKEDKRVIEFVKDIAENFPLADGSVLGAAQFLNLFLFPPEKQYTYISKLSGGEKRRLLLLSILFRNPNFLILDEPTNDLDLPTLNVLEEFLQNYPGCVLIVSHDRYFMDKIVDHVMVFEGNGIVRDFPGNYSQYREAESRTLKAESEKQKAESRRQRAGEVISDNTAIVKDNDRKRFSYKEQREYEMLEKEIPVLEAEKKKLLQQLSISELPYETLQEYASRMEKIIRLLDEKETRWLELGELKGE